MAGTGPTVECIWNAAAQLGEGPVWDELSARLYWVDIEAPAIHRCDAAGGQRQSFAMSEKIGFLVPRRGGGWVAGLQSGLYFVELPEPAASGSVQLTAILDPEPALPGNRFNDAKCDAAGRLWAGTMDLATAAPTGVLYRLDPDHRLHTLDDGYVVTNGQAFAPDGRTFYHNDTMAGVVYAFDCDPASGAIDNKRPLLRLPDTDGLPDGLTVDAAGDLWLAHWGGWRVTRFDPIGAVRQVIDLPVAQVTSCAFGGADLDLLFITTARTGLSAAALAQQPLAGGLFVSPTDSPGRAVERFRG